jgi:mRNA interferase RelE/StbE
MSPYKILISAQARKSLRQIDSVWRKRIEKIIESHLAINPLEGAKILRYDKTGVFSYRVGDYRILYGLEENTLMIDRIFHRKEGY